MGSRLLQFQSYGKWFMLLSLATAICLLHLPSYSCTYSRDLPICTPQVSFQLTNTTPTATLFLSTVKEVSMLLSYVAIDLGWNVNFPKPNDYDTSNLVNTFDPSNKYHVNLFGYCKWQPLSNKATWYCMDNPNGLDIISMIVRDLGAQLGVLSHTNTKILSDSLWILYRSIFDSFYKFVHDDDYRADKVASFLQSLQQGGPLPSVDQFKTVTLLLKCFEKLTNAIQVTELCSFALIIIAIALATVACVMDILAAREEKHSATSDKLPKALFFKQITLKLSYAVVTCSLFYQIGMAVYFLALFSIRYPYDYKVKVMTFNPDTGYWLSVLRFVMEFWFAVACYIGLSLSRRRPSKEVDDLDWKDEEQTPDSGETAICVSTRGSTRIQV
ncbi:AER135Wp [Eremothecium gossypii ATCC 10895]|uniref:Spore membrane assembly protein 2 n=1 Tax=Eremothecium gossypii (strain ATCC 10895 / CBS 109.51 / FGSC 9923 / NRRL Y-1056) TaxID=284811 RepID=SMA2_EREGS|nr:AER135Wp [Eremothecium gossypii ATCC 10895]Q756X9.1 RecName: Full=Spore membrane assembly protein 2 [Eremothecium gossypii ATCC 10895]AAS52818.1 AER135Wp [Eremothecium gossypii ATCC 10895]AEY97124.1 FAER135Wp [Eremothecium gossypii FDAG1]